MSPAKVSNAKGAGHRTTAAPGLKKNGTHGTARSKDTAAKRPVGARSGRVADELRKHVEHLRLGEVLIIERVRRGIVARMVATAPTHPPLTRADRAVLDEVDQELGSTARPDPVQIAASEFNALLAASYSTPEAAAHIGVTEGRIRQMLTASPPSLLGLKRGRAWWLPGYQFADPGGLVPGIQQVIERLPSDLHPVALWRWFVTPASDLEGEDAAPLSPLDWLRTGRDPRVAAQLARDLA